MSAQACRYLTGTTSWTDASVIDSGAFYPPAAKSAEARLRHYASVFDTVEVDSSYYALPSARNAMLWVERTPTDFVFTIKTFRLFTQHQTPPAALPADLRTALGPIHKANLYLKDLPAEMVDELWRRYLHGIEPLWCAGRLRAVLFQFAPWFTCTPQALRYVESCRERLGTLAMAVEFRHGSWFANAQGAQTLDFARRLGLVHVVVDEPQGFANTVPDIWEVTSPEFAVVRLHGRNAETWNLKGLHSSAERFKYLYSDAELLGLRDHIRMLGRQAACVQVLFNNNYADWGVRNALAMQALLRA